MNISYSKNFNKSLSKLSNKKLAEEVLTVIKLVKESATLASIPNLKKLKGYQNAYRIRIGDYRIGLFAESDSLFFAVFDHRKGIYKNFP